MKAVLGEAENQSESANKNRQKAIKNLNRHPLLSPGFMGNLPGEEADTILKHYRIGTVHSREDLEIQIYELQR